MVVIELKVTWQDKRRTRTRWLAVPTWAGGRCTWCWCSAGWRTPTPRDPSDCEPGVHAGVYNKKKQTKNNLLFSANKNHYNTVNRNCTKTLHTNVLVSNYFFLLTAAVWQSKWMTLKCDTVEYPWLFLPWVLFSCSSKTHRFVNVYIPNTCEIHCAFEIILIYFEPKKWHIVE